MTYSIHTLFQQSKPLLTAIYNSENGRSQLIPLYHSGTSLNIDDIEKNTLKIREIIHKLLATDNQIVLSDFKNHIKAFHLNLSSNVSVYDAILPERLHGGGSEFKDSERLAIKIAKWLADTKLRDWQKLFANAAIAYQELEDRGIDVAGIRRYPQWSQRVFSGRSKTSGFNLQGTGDNLDITNPDCSPTDVFLHFDWKAADIRIAAVLSNDQKLLDLTYHDDTYTVIAHELGVTQRSVAKRKLLRAINSMNLDSDVFELFPDLQKWIRQCRKKVYETGRLRSILGRRFEVSQVSSRKKSPPEWKVFNATMQGSIAHAMHRCVKSVWNEIGSRLVCEIHDCIIVSCPNDKNHIANCIQQVAGIMRTPFSGLLDDNPVFPVRVSMGEKWRKWKELRIVS